MDKRVIWIVVAVAIVATGIWFAKRPGEASIANATAPPGAAEAASLPQHEAGPTSSGDVAHPVNPGPVAEPAGAGPAPATTSAAADALPIDVSPGFEYLGLAPGEMKDTDSRWSQWRRHQQLQSEPRDEAWSGQIESALRAGIRQSLVSHATDDQRIELSVVECRTNGCEIQALGYMEDNRKPGVDLQFIVPELLSGNLGNEFDRDGLTMSLSAQSGHRVAYLIQLTRRKN